MQPDQPVSGEPRKFVRVASDTREWSSGVVRFTILTLEGHPERSYIVCEKVVMGRPSHRGGFQRFNLRLRDWNNLKHLIESDLSSQHGWLLERSGVELIPAQNEEVVHFVRENPGLLAKLLDLPNVGALSRESFEALNRLGMKVYVAQGRHLETILEKLSRASEQEFVQFASLLRDMRLGQVATLATLVKQKLQIISLFRTLTASKETREDAVHELIENNIWVANKRYEIVASDQTLARYLDENVSSDPELGRRPDLIVKRIPHEQRIVLIELKRPGVALRARHVGQVLEYKALIEQYRPNVQTIECFLFGYEKHRSFKQSADVKIATYSELVNMLEDEYRQYLEVLEESSSAADREEDVPF